VTLTRTRPAYRPYSAHVVRTQRLAPHFVRITFTGGEFGDFGTAGLDQRVKIVLPGEDGSVADIGQDCAAGDWHARWRALPDATRPPFRTYTVRRIDPVARELDIDFVLHEDPGPAGAWAAGAQPGAELVIVGPDERSDQSRIGLDWHPGAARRVLLAGDETAVPAILSIVETLDPDVEADVFVEVGTTDDVLSCSAHPGVRVHWLPRDGQEHGVRLVSAAAAWADAAHELLAAAAAPRRQTLVDVDVDRELLWDSPGDGAGEFYAWIAGEAATVKALRRLFVSGHGVDRARVAFMGYWRQGQAERQE